MEKQQYLEQKKMGPDPHARPTTELLYAYARGVAVDGPQTLLNQWLPRAHVRRLALRRYRLIAEYAAAKVPFYRDHYAQAGFRPETLATEADLKRVPMLTKPLLRQNAERMMSDDAPPHDKLLERSSSGSSGAPVKLFFDPINELPRRLQELRLLTSHGFLPWHTQLIFDHPGHLAPAKFLPQRLGLWRREKFPAWLPVDDALQTVRNTRPDVVHGVLSSLRLLAIAVKASGGLGYKPLLAVSKGELLDGNTRQLIESVFCCPLVDYYATEETGIIAWQCPLGTGYHIDEDHVYVETVREDGTPCEPGEVGEVVLTNLYQKAMPFIRYRVGDLAIVSPDPCPCGRGLPLLKSLQGRKIDLIVTPDGKVHHPMALTGVMEDNREVRTFRIAQVAPDKLHVEINWDDGVSPAQKVEAANRVTAELTAELGSGTHIELVEVGPFKHAMGEKFALVKGLRPLADLSGGTKNVKF